MVLVIFASMMLFSRAAVQISSLPASATTFETGSHPLLVAHSLYNEELFDKDNIHPGNKSRNQWLGLIRPEPVYHTTIPQNSLRILANSSPLLVSKIFGETSSFRPPKFPRGYVYQDIWKRISVPKDPPVWVNDFNDPLSEIPYQDYFPGPREKIDTPSYIERTIRKIYELPFKGNSIKQIIEAIKFLYYQDKYNNHNNDEEAISTTTTTSTTKQKESSVGKVSAFEIDEVNTTKTPEVVGKNENKSDTQGNKNEMTEASIFKTDQHNMTEKNVSNNQSATTPSNTVEKVENDDKEDVTTSKTSTTSIPSTTAITTTAKSENNDGQSTSTGSNIESTNNDGSTENPLSAGGGGGGGLSGLSVGGVIGGGIVGGAIVGGMLGGAANIPGAAGGTLGSLSASSAGNIAQAGQNARPSEQGNSNNNNNNNENNSRNDNKKSEGDDNDLDLDLDELEDLFTDNKKFVVKQHTAENISTIFIEKFKRLDRVCEWFKTNFTKESGNLTEFQNKYFSMASKLEDIREKLSEKIDEESSDEIYNEKIKVFNQGYLLAGLLNTFYDNVASINSSLVAYVEAIEYLQSEEYIFKYNITEIVLTSSSFHHNIYKDVGKIRAVAKTAQFRLIDCFGASLSAFKNWHISIKNFYLAGIELGRNIFLPLLRQRQYNATNWSEAVLQLTNFIKSGEQHLNVTQSFIDLEETTLDCIYNVTNFLFEKQGPILTDINNHTS